MILDALANSHRYIGEYKHAVSLFESSATYQEKIGVRKIDSLTMKNIALPYIALGRFIKAETNLRRRIKLYHKIEFMGLVGRAHCDLSYLYIYMGKFDKAKNNLSIASKAPNPSSDFQSYINSRRALGALKIGDVQTALKMAQLARDLADDKRFEVDIIRAEWLLGAAYRANNELTMAEENLSKALNLCRQINMVDHEADILLDLARLSFAYARRSAPGSAQDELFKDAQEKASEALMITERSGYVLQGADVNLFLTQYVLEQEKDKVKAKEYAEEAKKLATCDGPPYYYKVAYEEAERFLENLK